MTMTQEPNCLFKEQDTSTLVPLQACRTQSGPSGNYLSTRSQCFITLSSLSQTSHPSSFADNGSGAVCSYGYEWVTASLSVHPVTLHSLWRSLFERDSVSCVFGLLCYLLALAIKLYEFHAGCIMISCCSSFTNNEVTMTLCDQFKLSGSSNKKS